MRQQHSVVIPKVKTFARITLRGNKILVGYFFLDATARIQDVLNNDNGFFPFVTEGEEMQLINKFHVVNVEPLERTH